MAFAESHKNALALSIQQQQLFSSNPSIYIHSPMYELWLIKALPLYVWKVCRGNQLTDPQDVFPRVPQKHGLPAFSTKVLLHQQFVLLLDKIGLQIPRSKQKKESLHFYFHTESCKLRLNPFFCSFIICPKLPHLSRSQLLFPLKKQSFTFQK